MAIAYTIWGSGLSNHVSRRFSVHMAENAFHISRSEWDRVFRVLLGCPDETNTHPFININEYLPFTNYNDFIPFTLVNDFIPADNI